MTMEFNEEIVSSVVEKVIAALNKGGPCQPRDFTGLVDTVDEAVDRAEEAQRN